MGQVLCEALGCRDVYLFCQTNIYMLKSLAKIEVLSISSFSFISICFIYFDAMLLVAYSFRSGLDTSL